MYNIKFYKWETKEYLFQILFKIKFIRYLIFNFHKKYDSYKIFHSFNLNSNSIFIDIGANIGTVTHYIYDHFQCYIDAFEPHPGAYKILKKSFINLNKIKCHNYCISDKSEHKKFFMHNLSRSSKHLSLSRRGSLESSKKDIDKNKYFESQSKSIDELLNSYNHIDCIKIDIEGHEYKIIDQIINKKNKIKFVVCELHKNKFNDNNLNKSYNFTINKLKKLDLLNKWFFLWN